MKHNITDIFFDLDHTLWDFDKNSAITYKIVFKNLNLEVNLSHFLKVYEAINLELWRLFREDKITKNELRYKRLKDTFLAINQEVSDVLINQIADDYILYLGEQTHLFDGAIKTLEYLRLKYNLHIITNGFAEVQDKKLQHSNLAKYFNVIVNSETVGVKKPNPLIFEKALFLARVNKENSLMIGDSYEADILGAINCGIAAICFNYHNEKLPETIKSIDKLEELIDIL